MQQRPNRLTGLVRRLLVWTPCIGGAITLAACGGGAIGTGDSAGARRTILSVAASDPDGDTLHYQWRATAGVIENRDSPETTWTLPVSPGLHFAYVVVSDGKGGYVEQQYAVSSDASSTDLPVQSSVAYSPASAPAPAASGNLSKGEIRVERKFESPDGIKAGTRLVYVPDVIVKLDSKSAITDLSGEYAWDAPDTGSLKCQWPGSTTATDCSNPPSKNLQLHGHISLKDNRLCGHDSDFFSIQSSATVQLFAKDGVTSLSPKIRANRFGDYILAADVTPAQSPAKLSISCEGTTKSVDVPVPASGQYVKDPAIPLSYSFANSPPGISKMVATGPDGNLRGRMVVPLPGASSSSYAGPRQFLAFKGLDSRLSACRYYEALGAASACDAQGNLVKPINFEDWKKTNQFAPYGSPNAEVRATYVNRMDLNLVRRMVGRDNGANSKAFYVCNAPGPDGDSQAEVDNVIATAVRGENIVACVAMEWTTSPGSTKPFTKFFTFGPDGSLLLSVNLDGRGEKYMPGACVSCHGATSYGKRFSESAKWSADLGSSFLPFDTANYAFSSEGSLTGAAQMDAIYKLNKLVQATATATEETGKYVYLHELIAGWYSSGSVQNTQWVPKGWEGHESLYKGVIATSCRTCHAAFPFNFISKYPTPASGPALSSIGQSYVCGGTPDVKRNAVMPNALMSHDHLYRILGKDKSMQQAMVDFVGCSAPLPDPLFPIR